MQKHIYIVSLLLVWACSQALDLEEFPEDAQKLEDFKADSQLPNPIIPDVYIGEHDSALLIEDDRNICDGCQPGCYQCSQDRCVQNHEGEDVCSRLCASAEQDCGPGWECRLITNSGADATWLCAAREMPLCEPCELDDDCHGSGDNRCIEYEDGYFCGSDCSDGFCPFPGKYQCNEDYQCVLVDELSCSDCFDRDGDGYGIGEPCSGPDCNDYDVDINPGVSETCDNIDNDCDGQIDNSISENQIPVESQCPSLGICVDLEVRCIEGEWSCDFPETYEEVETRCDGLDNDCNGLQDDIQGRGEACSTGIGACSQNGVWICDGLSGDLICSATPAQPVSELCNGIDDDCDGVTDNVLGFGERCVVGLGSCEAVGEQLCDLVSGRLVCSAQPQLPQEEICDHRDNDCDGEIDEDICPLGPSEEICNGIDDDLDNQIDENLTRPCEGGGCGPGIERCMNGVWDECEAPQGGNEECNGIDDDCNGQVDENLERVCSNNCGLGIENCMNGEWINCNAPHPNNEICNGIDDNCNGQTDELLIRDCESECGIGESVCEFGQWQPCNAPSPQAEICNQRDDDCDGEIDENVCGVCAGQADGWIHSTGDWGECLGFSNLCDEVGERTRQKQVCREGEIALENETEDCHRETDGQLLESGPWGVCSGFSDQCDESGQEARSNRVCWNGAEQQEEELRSCERDTDGQVIHRGNWSDCSEFSNQCDETGRQIQENRVCRNGSEIQELENRECERNTDNQIVSSGDWGNCSDFSNQCDETGRQTKVDRVCQNSAEVQQENYRDCDRNTEGDVVSYGNWGACSDFSSDCDEAGIKTRRNQVCRGGAQNQLEESQNCNRNTDGSRCNNGYCNDGSCCEENHHQRCIGDDVVYWYDSCGNQGELSDSCTFCEECNDHGNTATCDQRESELRPDFMDENCDGVADLEYIREIKRFINRCNWSSWHSLDENHDYLCAPIHDSPTLGCNCNSRVRNYPECPETCWDISRAHYSYSQPVPGQNMDLMWHCYNSAIGSNRYSWSRQNCSSNGWQIAFPENLGYLFRSNPNRNNVPGLIFVGVYQCRWEYEAGKYDHFFTTDTHECNVLDDRSRPQYINPNNDQPQNAAVLYAWVVRFP